jgi:hypothetical protein
MSKNKPLSPKCTTLAQLQRELKSAQTKDLLVIRFSNVLKLRTSSEAEKIVHDFRTMADTCGYKRFLIVGSNPFGLPLFYDSSESKHTYKFE